MGPVQPVQGFGRIGHQQERSQLVVDQAELVPQEARARGRGERFLVTLHSGQRPGLGVEPHRTAPPVPERQGQLAALDRMDERLLEVTLGARLARQPEGLLPRAKRRLLLRVPTHEGGRVVDEDRTTGHHHRRLRGEQGALVQLRDPRPRLGSRLTLRFLPDGQRALEVAVEQEQDRARQLLEEGAHGVQVAGRGRFGVALARVLGRCLLGHVGVSDDSNGRRGHRRGGAQGPQEKDRGLQHGARSLPARARRPRDPQRPW